MRLHYIDPWGNEVELTSKHTQILITVHICKICKTPKSYHTGHVYFKTGYL